MAKRPVKPELPAAEPADDQALLREALKDVAPIPDAGKATLRRHPPKPIPVQKLRDDEQVLQESLSDHLPLEVGLETGDELVFLRDGLSNMVLRKLRRGHWVNQDELDLHGSRSEEARQLIVAFLNQALARGLRCVRIVHGKGLRSENREPVLKRKVGNWLAQRDEVLAFVQARPEDGGSGAVAVLLKAKRK
ncbi:MAG TPA: Smr/MutS family protein [Burkholderiales bacterium]|jgi:DNA-nicking Smr family endonuclease|nr:Smr/MutS family protein [Burkholderiales bacterium]